MSDLAILGRNHVMIDLETMSTRANAAIVSLGACKFTFETGITDEFLVNIDLKSCHDVGLHISKDTVEWWKKQPKEAMNAWKIDPQPIQLALTELNNFIGNDSKQFCWCQGASFDFPILHSAYTACNIQWGTKYWNEMCSRTVFNLLGIRNDKIRKNQTGNHTALADALSQTQTLIDAFMKEI
jgi:hypothetical protein